MVESSDYFVKYMDEKFRSLTDKLDGTNRRLDSIAGDVKELRLAKNEEHAAFRKDIEKNEQDIRDAKTIGRTLRWVWVIVGGLVVFIIERFTVLFSFFKDR